MKYAQLTTRQIALHKELCAAIDKNEDISERLKAEKSKDIKDLLAGYDDYNMNLLFFPISPGFFHSDNSNCVDLLFYAITSGKTKSAESILTYIDSKSFKKEIYSTLATNLFDACCAENKENAKTIIAFAKENNILESLLKKHLSNDVAEEFFKKDDNHQYVHNNTSSMITALEKHARNRDYTPKMGEHAKFFVEVLAIIATTTICATPLIRLDPAFIVLPLIGVVCMLSLIVVIVASEQYNNWSHKRDCNNDIIKGLQEQLKAEQNFQQQSAVATTNESETQEGEHDKSEQPSPDSNVSGIVCPEAAATGAIVGND